MVTADPFLTDAPIVDPFPGPRHSHPATEAAWRNTEEYAEQCRDRPADDYDIDRALTAYEAMIYGDHL